MILAIDDDITRYHYARQLFPLTVASCPRCVLRELKTARAVLLDYDLDSGEPCPLCFDSFSNWSTFPKASKYTNAILSRNIPVIIVSCSERKNIQLLRTSLKKQRPIVISAREPDHELKWLSKLKEWQAQW